MSIDALEFVSRLGVHKAHSAQWELVLPWANAVILQVWQQLHKEMTSDEFCAQKRKLRLLVLPEKPFERAAALVFLIARSISGVIGSLTVVLAPVTNHNGCCASFNLAHILVVILSYPVWRKPCPAYVCTQPRRAGVK